MSVDGGLQRSEHLGSTPSTSRFSSPPDTPREDGLGLGLFSPASLARQAPAISQRVCGSSALGSHRGRGFYLLQSGAARKLVWLITRRSLVQIQPLHPSHTPRTRTMTRLLMTPRLADAGHAPAGHPLKTPFKRGGWPIKILGHFF